MLYTLQVFRLFFARHPTPTTDQHHTMNTSTVTLAKIAALVGSKYSPLEAYTCSYCEGDISLLIKWDNGCMKEYVEIEEENGQVIMPTIKLPDMIASEQKQVREVLDRVSMIAHMVGTIHSAITMVRCGA